MGFLKKIQEALDTVGAVGGAKKPIEKVTAVLGTAATAPVVGAWNLGKTLVVLVKDGPEKAKSVFLENDEVTLDILELGAKTGVVLTDFALSVGSRLTADEIKKRMNKKDEGNKGLPE